MKTEKYGCYREMEQLNKAEKCPLGNAKFSSRDAMQKVCLNYLKNGYYIQATVRVRSDACHRCEFLRGGDLPPNVQLIEV